MSSPSRVAAWGVTLAALLLFAAGRYLVIPGLDVELLRSLFGPLATGPTAELSLFAVAVVPLFIVSLVLEVAAGSDAPQAQRRRRIGLAVYLVLCALAGLARAITFESYGRREDRWSTYFELFEPVLVPEPGLPFRLLAVLTWVAAGAVLWFLAEWVTRRGVAHGALLFAGTLALFHEGGSLREAVARLLREDPAPAFSLLGLLPWAIVLFALWRFAPPEWPIRVTGKAHLRGPWDALLLPGAVGLVVAESGGVASLPGGPEALNTLLGPRVISIAVSSAVAVALLVVLRARAARRGHPGFLVLGVLAPLPAVALAIAPLAIGISRQLEPGQFAGEGHFEVVLRCSDPGEGLVAADTRVIERRLATLKVDARIEPQGADGLRLQLREIKDASELLAAVAPPWRLAFHLVDDRAPVEDFLSDEMKELGVAVEYDGASSYLAARARPALEKALSQVERPEGTEFAIECAPDRSGTGERCMAHLLETPSALEGHIAEAQVQRNDWGAAEVDVLFDSEGARTFEDLTARAVGRKLAIVLDGEVKSVPVVQERISGGRARITLGGVGPPDQQFREAENLANALRTGPLGCRWITESVQLAK